MAKEEANALRIIEINIVREIHGLIQEAESWRIRNKWEDEEPITRGGYH
jgi:hypothetical protein